MAELDEVLTAIAESLDAYTHIGGNYIGTEHALDITIIDEFLEDTLTDTIGLETESGTRFFITVTAID